MRLLRNIASYARFLWMTPSADKKIVFYAEHEGYFPIFEGILDELTRTHARRVCYVTSDPEDPILVAKRSGVRTFYLDSLLPLFMRFVNPRVVVMTLPDLDNLYLKRSINPVHYVYMFHSMCSTHMGYRPGAFDNYDSILCTSPHQIEEIRRSEELYNLKPKILVEAGYHRLERICEAFRKRQMQVEANRHWVVLIAPTWSQNNLLESHGEELVEVMRRLGCRVILRIHPEMIRRQAQLLATLEARYRDDPLVELEKSAASDESLLKADLLVTDWSGIALEYGFGTLRPVIFIDAPKKINNPKYEELGIEPFEVSMRQELGVIIPPNQIPQIGSIISRLLKDRAHYSARMTELREQHVYAFGRSGDVGARHIMQLLRQSEPTGPGSDTDRKAAKVRASRWAWLGATANKIFHDDVARWWISPRCPSLGRLTLSVTPSDLNQKGDVRKPSRAIWAWPVRLIEVYNCANARVQFRHDWPKHR